jgi:ssDNA-binding Zn-finger/Zn-ribbon topoisomerase 1
MDLIVVETVNKCPFCGGVLDLVEDARYVWLGCRRCMRYVRREKRTFIKNL